MKWAWWMGYGEELRRGLRFGFDKVVEADQVCWGKGVKVGKRGG